jgi:hypothetical protein
MAGNGNIALAFGALLGGAVVVDYGVKAFKGGLSSSGGASSGSGGSGGGGTTAATAPTLSNGGKGSPVPNFAPKTTSGVPGVGASKFSASRLQFANTLAKDSGLDVNVILAWMANEQGFGADPGHAEVGLNNWLNVGITGKTPDTWYGVDNPAWSNPITAANETYYWMTGHAIQDYGAPGSKITAIPATAGKSVEEQLAAITSSGWASGGETVIHNLYTEIVG